MDIKGHAAIVTGGASGLGAATAEMLAQAGAKVACLDVNLDGARAVAGRIGGCAVRATSPTPSRPPPPSRRRATSTARRAS